VNPYSTVPRQHSARQPPSPRVLVTGLPDARAGHVLTDESLVLLHLPLGLG